MSSNTQPQSPSEHRTTHDLLTNGQMRLSGALILIALGCVFFLTQSGQMDYSSPWWVLFIAIPGVTLLYAAFTTFQQTGMANSKVVSQSILGILALLISFIFIVDPNWSFTQRLTFFNDTFPFLRNIDWDQVWPWLLVLLGVGIIVRGVQQGAARSFIPGGVLILVGLVFLFNISWDAVWPLAIVAVGVGMLLGVTRNK